MVKEKFYTCRYCGNLIGMLHNAGIPMMCCGQKMELLVPNTTEAAGEKHLPVVTVEDGTIYVNVGEVSHPMAGAHHIEWLYIETENGGQHRIIHSGDAPEAAFCIGEDRPIAVYAYCNLHGLWMTEIA